MTTIQIIHNSRHVPPVLEKALDGLQLKVNTAASTELVPALAREAPETVILYIEGPAGEGISRVFDVIRKFDDNLPLIVVAESKTLDDAVAAMKAGAYDYFPLPLDKSKFKNSVAHAVRLYGLTKRVFLLENQMGFKEGLDDIIGASPKMREVFNLIGMVAKSNATVLILGESGTGKELVAKAIHRHSPRRNKALVDINCGAIPRELLENEMFGHERGAYTGADRRYTGSFERAHGGTMFLDEISEMEPKLQVKLLRFLQERSFTRVGGTEPIAVDVRIVAATNRDIDRMVEEGKFREDLFYRLNVVPIRLPPLRERREDIPLLAKYFLQKMTQKNEKIFLDFSPQVVDALVSYDWPGNVRELENVVERVVVLHNDTRVKISHMPPVIRDAACKKAVAVADISLPEEGKIIPLELVEKYAIEAALKHCMGNVADAARKLKIGQATLYRKIKEYGLKT